MGSETVDVMNSVTEIRKFNISSHYAIFLGGRMKRIFISILCMLTIGLFISTVSADQGEGDFLCIPLGNITLSAPQGVEAKRSPVDFPHAVHFNYSCMECHHEWKGDLENLSCKTSGCHDSIEPDKGRPERYYKTAYHNQCIVCHKEIVESNKKLEMSRKAIQGTLPKTGPTGCVECHPKN